MKTLPNKNLLKEYIRQYHIERFFPEEYFDSLVLLEYKAGEFICTQGEFLNNLCFFVNGSLKIIRTLDNGKELILDIRKESCILGEIEFMANQPIVSSVVALSRCHVIALPAARLRQQLIHDPTFLYNVANWLANELYDADINRISVALHSVKEQFALQLLSYKDEESFSLNLSILADRFGTSYRHLFRVINQFIDAGILERSNRKYKILDYEKLEQIVYKEE